MMRVTVFNAKVTQTIKGILLCKKYTLVFAFIVCMLVLL